MKRPLLSIIVFVASGFAAADCELPLPARGASVSDYLMQTNRAAEKSATAQLHAALFDLVEYMPMGCSDAEPDDSYSKFRIRTASRDENGCTWLRLGIVPPGAPANREPTTVLCTPANMRVGGWSCRLLPPA